MAKISRNAQWRAVQGRTIYGDVPPADFGHTYDAGGEQLIPTTSIEQFAAPLGAGSALLTGQSPQRCRGLQALADRRSFTSKRLRLYYYSARRSSKTSCAALNP